MRLQQLQQKMEDFIERYGERPDIAGRYISDDLYRCFDCRTGECFHITVDETKNEIDRKYVETMKIPMPNGITFEDVVEDDWHFYTFGFSKYDDVTLD